MRRDCEGHASDGQFDRRKALTCKDALQPAFDLQPLPRMGVAMVELEVPVILRVAFQAMKHRGRTRPIVTEDV